MCRMTSFVLLSAVAAILVLDVPAAQAQFGIKIPKVPNVPGVEEKDDSKPANTPKLQGPAPEITAISPDSIPPGWEGDFVFTGKNFARGMVVKPECDAAKEIERDTEKGVQIDNPGHATLHVKVAPSAPEGKCSLKLFARVGDFDPSKQATPTTVQVPNGLTFAVSESSPTPVPFHLCFIGEGDLSPIELTQKVAESAMAKAQQFTTTGKATPDDCTLWISPSAVKYTGNGQTVFDQPSSAVKSFEPLLMLGNDMGMRRMAMSNGKIYNFAASDPEMMAAIKRKLKK